MVSCPIGGTNLIVLPLTIGCVAPKLVEPKEVFAPPNIPPVATGAGLPNRDVPAGLPKVLF